jgi:hypothetical protein
MAGTINLALTQQLDEFGEPLSGGQLYFIQASTISTPQNAYQDFALSIPLPNPVTLDAAGRVPMFYLADGQIKVRLQDSAGIVKFVADNLLVIGPSSGSGGGGGSSVDPTTVMQTGDMKIRYDTIPQTGFVRCNGLTIGDATSGATEAYGAQCQALFQYLWNTDSTLAVLPSRGATASADWTAHKQITLPDGRSRLLAGLGGMGNTDNGIWANVPWQKGGSNTLGSMGGTASATLGVNNIPPHVHGVILSDPQHSHPGSTIGLQGNAQFNITSAAQPGGNNTGRTDSAPAIGIAYASTGCYVQDGAGNHNQTASVGGGLAFSITPPILLITVYMKL